jgi:hypothetical protein
MVFQILFRKSRCYHIEKHQFMNSRALVFQCQIQTKSSCVSSSKFLKMHLSYQYWWNVQKLLRTKLSFHRRWKNSSFPEARASLSCLQVGSKIKISLLFQHIRKRVQRQPQKLNEIHYINILLSVTLDKYAQQKTATKAKQWENLICQITIMETNTSISLLTILKPFVTESPKQLIGM